jgi:hypothetical protein
MVMGAGVADIGTDLLAAPGPAQRLLSGHCQSLCLPMAGLGLPGQFILLKCLIKFELQKKGSGRREGLLKKAASSMPSSPHQFEMLVARHIRSFRPMPQSDD